MKMIKTTLVLVYDAERVLLGMKKRGFGAGKWNGFGGKVKGNEDICDAAYRELKEEVMIDLKKESLHFRGRIDFHFDDKKSEVQAVHFFSVHTDDVVGRPVETSEMRPQWFSHENIPYHAMWVDDQYWMPQFLEGKNLSGSVHFNADGSEIKQDNMIFFA